VVEKSLQRNGYRTLTAVNAVEALRMCEHQVQIDLLLTDVVMPEMNGRELALRLRGVYPRLRVLFFSGYQDDEQLTKEIGDGIAKFLSKPATTMRLVRMVREVLDAND
jgi:two-component system, cell cycle sensor histidine kinase and response regulator CckA